MKIYAISSDFGLLKCPGCNWEHTALYYTCKDEARRDLALIKHDERPQHGLCAECFLSCYVVPVSVESDTEVQP